MGVVRRIAPRTEGPIRETNPSSWKSNGFSHQKTENTGRKVASAGRCLYVTGEICKVEVEWLLDRRCILSLTDIAG